MPNVRHLSGDEVIRIFDSFGFKVVSQRGSHVKMRRMTSDGRKQTLTVPRHRELDVGTLQAIRRQASRYISQEELRDYFFSD